ncbi:hypothetical protein [Bacillus toyonensis]|uniref:hypothetical protein n=1 Tax=Bacillus toyonensis TaxID=155322 RepID=UPI000BF1066A|nr:hypothetical protein [Bacillus toyonensis]PEK30525.1 hypothetical protein CN897_27295 [Bacillus toyonensis]
MDFNKLLAILNEINSTDGKNLIEKLDEQKELNDILFNLSDQKREEVLKKITLFTKSDVKPETKDRNDVFIPALSKLDFVHCDFTGVGYEWDGAHYGVVWEVNPKFDAVTIIPATSKSRTEYANVIPIGNVLGLPPGDTTLLVSDMTKVSRKRIQPVSFNHWQRGVTRSRLKPIWAQRIVEAIAVTFGNEITFEQYLKESTGVAMPDNLDILRSNRFKPIRGIYDRTNNILKYRVWNQDNWHTITMKYPHTQFNKHAKAKLVVDLLSPISSVRIAAEEKYLELYH